MSAIALKSLSVAVSLFEDYLRQKLYADLKRSDVTGQRFREFIIRTLDSIQEKLDGLARTDLLTGLNFFKDGVTLLYGYLESEKETSEDEKEGTDKKDRRSSIFQSLAVFGLWSSSHDAKDEGSDEMSVLDDSFLEEAKAKFQRSAEYATKALSNESLKYQDRILAARLRIISTLLEHIDNTAPGVMLCGSYIEQLNAMEDVSSSFAIQFGTGAKAELKRLFTSVERKEFVWSVIAINRILWHFARLFGADDAYFTNWPRIVYKNDIEVHPVLDSRVRELFQVSFKEDSDADHLNCPQGLSISDECNFLIADTCNNAIKVYSPLGVYMYSFKTPSGGEQSAEFWPRCVTYDADGRTYAGSSKGRREDSDMPAAVFVFDKHGKFISSFGSDVLTSSSVLTSITIDSKNQLLISDDGANCIHVFTLDGQYVSNECSWESHEGYTHIAVTARENVLATHWDHVRIYKDGQYVTKFVVKGYGLPIEGIAYDSKREWVYIYSKAYKHLEKYKYPNVQIYDSEWNLEGIMELPKSYRTTKAMAMDPNGFVAVVNVDENEIALL
ncbi:predicted protein [Nematostella vectensis]|uniref:Uncharacterized protein n=1 Tax=Nematostella vectensis TaxID=45351 RepID=A7S3J1_NEMVE|nr:uncharacterized protein LOC5513595 [Nematostella vectensis]EDO41735.1 predicted protein [Nematostella vectensis]|eukprot:XP_001633798.1 predicted protein [Nematostella vectensis]